VANRFNVGTGRRELLSQAGDNSPRWGTRDWAGREKEKGRLLAPFLQFRKETAAERSARCYPEEAGCDKPCAVTAVFVALPRQAWA